jgi:glycosyltransferase involved in cell wall biosynthesis
MDGAALLANPDDPGDIADKLISAINDETLRKALIEKGTRQCAEFSWRECAIKTLAVYESIT